MAAPSAPTRTGHAGARQTEALIAPRWPSNAGQARWPSMKRRLRRRARTRTHTRQLLRFEDSKIVFAHRFVFPGLLGSIHGGTVVGQIVDELAQSDKKSAAGADGKDPAKHFIGAFTPPSCLKEFR